MKSQVKILLIDDDEAIVDATCQTLKRESFKVSAARTGDEGLELFANERFHAVLLDLRMPGLDGMSVLERMKSEYPEIPIIIITGYATVDSAVEAMKKGAFDFLSKPFTPQDLRLAVSKALKNREIVLENIYLRKELAFKTDLDMVVGSGTRMQEIMSLVARVAPSDSTVLVTGESGTGKELLSREIHRQSQRSAAPFVIVDCVSIVETLFESELFGHTKGSFTGAYETKHGRFEIADGGTIFFDEIGNIGPGIQAKLLRAIQEKEIVRVGSTTPIKVDVRIIAATNEDLEERVRQGRFREDLYYRLSVVPLHLPPLRERIEDIPLLVDRFIRKHNRRMKKKVASISPEVEQVLTSYGWPGNIRELENTIERAIVLSQDDNIVIDNLMLLGHGPTDATARPSGSTEPPSVPPSRPKTLEEVEKQHIMDVLKTLNGHKSLAAEVLGVDRKTLWAKLKKYGIE
jgi:DNA-binding NtrC family response regulator